MPILAGILLLSSTVRHETQDVFVLLMVTLSGTPPSPLVPPLQMGHRIELPTSPNVFLPRIYVGMAATSITPNSLS